MHPKPITRDRIATGIGIASQIKDFCHRRRITRRTYVVTVYGAEELATERGEVQVPVNPWSFL
jgi:hypothetical protein